MSRTVKKKNKRYASISEECNRQQDVFFQCAFTKWERILSKLPNGSTFFVPRNRERLSGGADKAADDDEDTNTPEDSALSEVIESPDLQSQVESTEHIKVDGIISYAFQNLQEASKALANLGESHEQDLKLMLTGMVGKVQNWMAMVQEKIDAAEADLRSLEKKLTAQSAEVEAKERELTELKTKLTESEMAKSAYEKALSENVSRTISKSGITMTGVPAVQSVAGSIMAQESFQQQQVQDSLIASEVMSPSISSHPPTGIGSVETAGAPFASMAGSITTAAGNIGTGVGSFASGALGSIAQSHQGVPLASQADFVSQMMNITVSPSVEMFQANQSHPASIRLGKDPSMGMRQDSSVQRSFLRGQAHPSAIPIEQLPYDQSLQACLEYGGSQLDRGQEQERVRDQKQIELEAECARLKSENERMVKEHTEYENAIQRALLRGVSSLNVEALKVLKSPPLGCCFPCAPCNPPSTSTTTPNAVGLPKSTRDNWTPQGDKSILSYKFDGICRPKEKTIRLPKKPATTVCYTSGGDSKKSSQNSMVFLLPQQQGSSSCSPFPKYCSHLGNSKAKSTVGDKNFCPGKSSNSTDNRDILYSNSRDHPRVLDYADIFAAAAKRNFEDAKHCKPCNRTNRFYDE